MAKCAQAGRADPSCRASEPPSPSMFSCGVIAGPFILSERALQYVERRRRISDELAHETPFANDQHAIGECEHLFHLG